MIQFRVLTPMISTYLEAVVKHSFIHTFSYTPLLNQVWPMNMVWCYSYIAIHVKAREAFECKGMKREKGAIWIVTAEDVQIFHTKTEEEV